jgi:hypothetical protein
LPTVHRRTIAPLKTKRSLPSKQEKLLMERQ